MPRPKKVDRTQRIEVQIPASILTKVKLELYSELEGRVPFGSMSELTTELMTDWLKARGIEA